MTELSREDNSSGPNSDRAFSKRRFFVLPGLKAQLIFWPLMVIGLALDLWSKKAIFDWLWLQQPNSFSVIDGFLQLRPIENPGGALGILPGQSYLLTAVSIIAMVVIFAIFLFSGTKQTWVHIALALFTAGVCGNLWDRIFNDGRGAGLYRCHVLARQAALADI
ncbi:MAG: signal peptidase II [bacterium]